MKVMGQGVEVTTFCVSTITNTLLSDVIPVHTSNTVLLHITGTGQIVF